MKKRIICLMLTVILALLTVCPAYATATAVEIPQDEWVLSPDGQKVTCGDKTYIYIEFPYEAYIETDLGWKNQNLSFTDRKAEEKYDGSFVYITSGAEDVAIEVGLYTDGFFEEMRIYAEEAYYDEFVQISEGKVSNYLTFNSYYDAVSVTNDMFEVWTKGEPKTMSAKELSHYDWYVIYGTDSNNVFRYELGTICYDAGSEELYLVVYNENGGEIGSYDDADVMVHELEDGELKDRLIESYNYLPEDELDWLVSDAPSNKAAGVFSIIVFGVIPLGIVIFGVVMLIVKKNRKYRRPLIILISGASAVLVSCITIFAILA